MSVQQRVAQAAAPAQVVAAHADLDKSEGDERDGEAERSRGRQSARQPESDGQRQRREQ